MADKVIPETGCSDLGIVLLYVAGGWNLWLMYGRGCWGVDGCHVDGAGLAGGRGGERGVEGGHQGGWQECWERGRGCNQDT